MKAVAALQEVALLIGHILMDISERTIQMLTL
jgi:hypothetical protein